MRLLEAGSLESTLPANGCVRVWCSMEMRLFRHVNTTRMIMIMRALVHQYIVALIIRYLSYGGEQVRPHPEFQMDYTLP